MKNIFTLILITSLSLSVSAQFSDDFESYNSGDYLAESSNVWSTWSGAGEGTEEDVQVTSDMANGGNNSIFLEYIDVANDGASVDGPQDLLLSCNAIIEEGIFIFEADFFIPLQSTGFYFNFQGDTVVGLDIGQWTLNGYMTFDQQNTNIEFAGPGDQETPLLALPNSFAPNTWFNLRIEANLTANEWTVLIDDEFAGNFINEDANGSYTEIASVDFYPVAGNLVYIDNVYVEAPNNLDAVLTSITTPTNLPIPVNQYITGNITNVGNQNITSMDITWTDGTDSFLQEVTGLNLGTFETYSFSHPDALTSDEIGSANITVTVDNINGDGSSADEDQTNNEMSTVINFTAPPASWNCDPIKGCVDPTDGSGEFNSLTLCMINCNNTNIKEFDDLKTLITPNPTSDNTILNFSAKNMDVIIEIKNISGQIISTQKYGVLDGEQKINLNTSSLNKGIYLIDLKRNQKSSIHKLIKQ
mgnify:CR=1 FL=1